MRNKINPQQYTPYALNAPSGNLIAVEHIDYFDIFLLERLTGNFSVTGSLTVNGAKIYSSDITNDIEGVSTFVFNGKQNLATGSNNTIVGSYLSEVQNSNNLILGGRNNIISGQYSTAIGSYIVINDTGAMVLKDSTLGEVQSNGHNSLTVSFVSGMFVNNKSYFNDELWITGGNAFVSGNNLTITDDFYLGGSGLFSGDINILGTAYHTGSKLQNLQNLLDSSGSLLQSTRLASGIQTTGLSNLDAIVLKKTNIPQTLSGSVTFDQTFYLKQNQTLASSSSYITPALTGYNRFLHNSIGAESFQIDSYGSVNIALNGINGTIKDPTGYSTLHTRNSFSVTNDTPSASSIDLLFSVNQSGDAFIKRGIIRDPRVAVPASHDAPGVSGQMIWGSTHLYFCTGWKGGSMYSGWSRIAIGNW